MTIQTKFNEVRKITSDPKEMLNKYIVRRVLRTWKEDFVDEDTGNVVTIERNEVLFDIGTLIDQDILARIKFDMSAGDITEIEVSNQKRIAHQLESTYLHPFIAQAVMSEKKVKFLFYATNVGTALLLLKDYIELNYSNGFYISMIKEFDSCIILTDTLKKAKADIPFDEWDNIDPDEINDEDSEDKKFYQIGCRINYDDDYSTIQNFVVHSFNVDRCMMLIDRYLRDQQDIREKEARERGNEYKRVEFHTMIETAKTIPVGCFIPKEFSEAYRDQEDNI
ncbi:MAG: RNA polymerase subunit sigma [Prevotella sp.]|jgi:hypothetical protein|nr:RNA polymerase subunit sigma [Prevotella sp.]